MRLHKILLLSAIAITLFGVCLVSNSCGTRSRAKGPSTPSPAPPTPPPPSSKTSASH